MAKSEAPPLDLGHPLRMEKKNIPDVDLLSGQIVGSFNIFQSLFILTGSDASFKQLASILLGNYVHWLVLTTLICQVIFTSIDGRTFGVALHLLGFALKVWEFKAQHLEC